MNPRTVSRRDFFRTTLVGACGIAAAGTSLPALAARRLPRITEIERHEILIPYRSFNAQTLFRYHGVNLQTRTVYIVKTDQGLEGYGETWGPGPEVAEFARYIDTTPFDWINAEDDLPINMAVYDLMGKFLDVPAWRLIGPQVRDSIPVGAWTVSRTPEEMAGEVLYVARLGYHWLKYHIDELQNVIDQTAAMQKVAPEGFRVLYDFNVNSTLEAVEPVIDELVKFPIVGGIEDPITASDRDGYRKLRAKYETPILIHHGPNDFMTDGLCDALIAGHAPIGKAAKIAAIAEHTNTPIMLQQAGGTINQAFLAHEAAVFPTATFDHVNLAHLWDDDVTTTRMPVVNSRVRVPTAPGLGIEIDRDKLARYEQAARPKYRPFLVRIRYEGGPTIYTRHNGSLPGDTDNMRFLNRLLGDKIPGPTPGYGNAVRSEFLDAKSTGNFDQLWAQTESGPFVVP